MGNGSVDDGGLGWELGMEGDWCYLTMKSFG